MIYLIIPAVFILIYLLCQCDFFKKLSAKIAFCSGFFVIFILLILRSSSVGIDTETYVNNFFIKYGESSWGDIFSKNNEWGFAILCKLIYFIWPNENFFFAVVGLICTLPMLVTYCRNIKSFAFLAFMIFLSMTNLSMMFSGMRQAIAVSIMTLAYKPLVERKFIQYCFLVLIASLFHISAIITLIFYFLYAVPLTKNSFIITIPVLLIAFVSKKFLMQLILKIMVMISEKYQNYQIKDTPAFLAFLVYFVIIIILYFFNPLFANNKKGELGNVSGQYKTLVLRKKKVYDKKINLMLTLCFIQIFASINYGAARVSMFLIAYLPIIVSEYFDSYKLVDRNADKVIFYSGFIAVFSYQFIMSIVVTGVLGMLPYVPLWR